MAQGEDLALQRVLGVERLLEQELRLDAGGGLVVVAAAAQEVGGQRDRHGLGPGAAGQRDVAPGSGAKSFAMEPGQDLAGDLAEPQEGIGPVRPVVLAPAADDLLVDPLRHGRGVEDPDEPEAHAAAVPLLVALEEGLDIGSAAVSGSGCHALCLAFITMG